MMFRRCMFSISSLVALAVVCGGQEQQVVGSQPPKMNTSESAISGQALLTTWKCHAGTSGA